MTAPTSIRAGDSAEWTESLPTYPASDGWYVVVRVLRATGAAYEVESEPSGDAHIIQIPAEDTQDWAAGHATLVRLVKRPVSPDHDEVKTLSGYPLEVLPNLATATNADGRSAAERALADAELALQEHLASGRAHVQAYSINGRQFTFRTVAELRELIEMLRRDVYAERARKAALHGHAPGRIFTRF